MHLQIITWIGVVLSNLSAVGAAGAATQEYDSNTAVGGAARGALGGAAIGAIAGDAGKGAAIGAVTGGLFGAMRR